jgi:hypothetical protein
MRRPRPPRGCRAIGEKKKKGVLSIRFESLRTNALSTIPSAVYCYVVRGVSSGRYSIQFNSSLLMCRINSQVANNNNNNNKYHIISACQILAKEQYIKRHDSVCAQLHFNTCKEIRVQLGNEHPYEYVRKLVETSDEGKVTVLWNQQLQTDRTITNNKPDIIMRDNEKGTYVNRCCNLRRQKCN